MKNKKLDSTPIRQEAKGRWLSILGTLCPDIEKQLSKPGKAGSCPVHGGKDGFRLFRDADSTGGGICNTCGAKPDGFALLMWMNGWDFPTTLEAVANTLGYQSAINRKPVQLRSVPVKQKVISKPTITDDWIKKMLKATWGNSFPWYSSNAGLLRHYLQQRGLDIKELHRRMPLRFHPSLECRDSDGQFLGKYPAMLALMYGPDGKASAIHRTFLNYKGQKAPVESPKMLTPHASDRPVTGGAIRLGIPGSSLGLSEGIETALAVIQVTRTMVWPTYSCTLLEKFIPPAGVNHLVVWSDRDTNKAGQNAAYALKARLELEGIQVTIMEPPGIDMDWLDVLNQFGPSVFPAIPESTPLLGLTG
ncbi:MAG: toprim domain-containing protein [Methylococcales bacterium]